MQPAPARPKTKVEIGRLRSIAPSCAWLICPQNDAPGEWPCHILNEGSGLNNQLASVLTLNVDSILRHNEPNPLASCAIPRAPLRRLQQTARTQAEADSMTYVANPRHTKT